MTDSVDVFALSMDAQISPSFRPGEIASLPCARCKRPQLPWDLRSLGPKSICSTCYDAVVELAQGAIKAMPSNEPNRLCRNCRAIKNPALGSAWCGLTELTDERARICENFVPESVDSARSHVTGSRARALDVWQAVEECLRGSLGDDKYETWFGDVEPLALEGGSLSLRAPDDHTRDWLQQRFGAEVHAALGAAGCAGIVPVYVVEVDSTGPTAVEPKRIRDRAGFNTHYTFAEFVVGSTNRLGHASALATVDKPGQAYNPLVLYGGVGVGKTHLLQAIGQEVLERTDRIVLYTTSETFTNELIHAIRDGSTNAFRERYRHVDYLLLDDIQFIAGKEATQEEFFHTFNALHQAGKQIVVTSDRPPSDLRTLEDRLRSRFAWGLAVDMQPPDLETRTAILRSKADMHQRRIPETVLDALAHRIRGNVRELEGALNRVLALADLLGTEPDMDVVRRIIGDPDTAREACRPADVIQAVSAYYRVKPSDLTGQQRERGIAYARQMAMYLMREESKLSLVEVGQQLGGRNHSTVIYGCDRIAGEVKRKTRVRQDLQAIKQMIYGVQ